MASRSSEVNFTKNYTLLYLFLGYGTFAAMHEIDMVCIFNKHPGRGGSSLGTGQSSGRGSGAEIQNSAS